MDEQSGSVAGRRSVRMPEPAETLPIKGVPPVPLRVSAFIDGSNFFYAQRRLNMKIDFRKFRHFIDSYGDVINCIYYTGFDSTDEGQYRFLDMLSYNGFSVEKKELKLITQEDGSTYRKANLDIELVLDMFNLIDTYDLAFVVTGDGDFERPLQHLRARGKHFKVLSTDDMMASELRRVVGPHFVDLAAIRHHIERV